MLIHKFQKLWTPKPFLLNFNHVATLGTPGIEGASNSKLSSPIDVKISYLFNILLVSDANNTRTQVFDLRTKLYKQTIYTHSAPWYMDIEVEYDEQGSEAIIMTCGDYCLYKYDLATVLQPRKDNKRGGKHPFLWKTGKLKEEGNDRAQSLVIKYDSESEDGNLIYYCDSGHGKIKVLRAWDGVLLRVISQMPCVRNSLDSSTELFVKFVAPCGIDMRHDGQNNEFVVSDMGANMIYFIREIGDDWIVTKSLPKGLGDSENIQRFEYPTGLCIDKKSGNVIICDYLNGVMQILDKNGNFIKTFGSLRKSLALLSNNEFFYHTGVCINETEG